MCLFILAALDLGCCARAFPRCREQELLCSCGWTHRGGVSCCGAQALGATASALQYVGSKAAVHLFLQSTGLGAAASALQHVGSEVAVHQLRGSSACGIFPEQVSNPCSLHWQMDSYPPCHQGSPPSPFLSLNFLLCKMG